MTRQPTRWLCGLLASAALAPSAQSAAAETAVDGRAGWHRQRIISEYSPLAAQAEFSRRVLLPTEADRLARYQQQRAVFVAEHSVDLAQERFDVFVPAAQPPNGYALLVFISPLAEAFPAPPDWRREFERRGIIYISAHRSGNQENVLERRLPLALHAYQHVLDNYPVDATRVMVGGFSGGARLAQRLAQTYPDVFRAALLFAGSDPLGSEQGTPPPTAELMRWLRERSRIVFATGAEDLPNRGKDERSRASLAQACVANVSTLWLRGLGHWVPDRRGLAKALDAAEAPPLAVDAACIDDYQRGIDSEMAAVVQLLEQGDPAAAGAALGRLEERVGGLAAPQSLTLARRIAELLEPSTSGARSHD